MLLNGPNNPKTAHSLGDLDPIYYMVPWTHISLPNDILTASAVFAGLTNVTNRPTDHATPSVAIGRISAMHAMRLKMPTNRCNTQRKLCAAEQACVRRHVRKLHRHSCRQPHPDEEGRQPARRGTDQPRATANTSHVI